jgi:flagellar hook assembly protein FlgD
LQYTLDAKASGNSWSVRFHLFDSSGRLVRTLVDGKAPSGQNRITWDGTDASGRPLSSGVYFYRLEADSLATSGKIVLLR